MVFCLFSCGDDEAAAVDCVQADWVGTYFGTIECEGGVEDLIITITASDSDVIISYVQESGLETEYDPLTPDGCEVEQSAAVSGATYSFNADLDGTTFTAEEKTVLEDPLLNDIVCTINAMKI